MFETADTLIFVYDDEKKREQRALDALYEIGKLLAGGGAVDRIVPPALRVLASFTGLQQGCVAGPAAARSDGDGTTFRPRVVAAADRSVTDTVAAAIAPVLGGVLRTGVAGMVKDVVAELGTDAVPAAPPADTAVAFIATPIRAADGSGRTVGALAAYRLYQRARPPMLGGDLRLLAMVAGLMAPLLRPPEATAEAPAPTSPGRPRAKALDDLRIIGRSPEIEAVLQRIAKVAPTRATVLLRGESGTGKELFATAVHRLSGRSDKPLVKLNCAALSENLLESELFGHEKGAFTGAIERKKGRFELAHGGTLFLDEIGDISPAFQVKLLRALQEGEFERVGGSQTIRVDVRLVTATNRDLEAAVVRGEFRADLYFRICVVPVTLPPLRERRGDIPPLAQTFLDRFNDENGARLRFSASALDRLSACAFPGNIRELENCVNRVATLAPGPVIDVADLTCVADDCLSPRLQSRAPEAPAAAAPAPVEPDGPATRSRQELIDAMEKSGWVQAKAARLLGMTSRQIGYALKKHGIDVVKF